MDINNINKNRYFSNFKKDKKLIIAVILVILFWSLIYQVIFYIPAYKSTAKIWIKNLTTEEFVANLSDENQLSSLTSAGNPLLTQIEILKSTQLKNFVISYSKKKHGNKYLYQNFDHVIDVKNKPATDILNITLTWDNPNESQELLNSVLEEYDNINLLINQKIRTARRKYIDLKLSEIDKKLFEIRDKIKLFKSSNLAISIDEESIKLVDQKVEITSKREDVRANIYNIKSTILELENQLSLNSQDALNAVALGSGNQTLVKLRDDLNTAVQEYEFDSSKFSDSNPKMIAQKNKISTINSQIKNQIKLSIGKYINNKGINIFDPTREKLVENLVTSQALLMGLLAEKASFDNSIIMTNAEQSKIPQKKFTLDNLEQEERALSKAYDELREKQIEAKIKEAEAVSNVIIVDPPSLPISVSFPTRFEVFIIAFILGGILSATISILKTLIEDICDDIESIEQITGTSLIGTIPWVKNVTIDSKFQLIHEIAFNNILSNLLIKCYKSNIKVLTFTSSSLIKPQSSIIYFLACRLKKLGHSVVVLDSDFKMPTLLKEASVDNKLKINLSDLIVSFEAEIKKTKTFDSQKVLNVLIEDKNGINYLGNKEIVFDSYEFFGTASFERIITILKNEFDWVLIDTAAAHITPEFLIISRLSDGVILFINKTITYSILKNITKSLKNAHIPIIGAIVREAESRLEIEYEKYLKYQKNHTLDDTGFEVHN